MRPDILWTSHEAEAITGGRSSAPWVAGHVCLKLDALQAGDMFFAGPEDDVVEAAARGASVIVASHLSESVSGVPVLHVKDVFESLRALAHAARFRTHGIVIAAQGGIREALHASLSSVANVYEGGRHLSLGMAAMPENCCYGIFGFSPSVRPDVAVISDCTAALNSTMLESLPDNGIVIINADDPAFLDVFARAKSCGTRSIFTYGLSQMADGQRLERVAGANGMHLSLRVFGEILDLDLPAGVDMNPAALVAMMVLSLMNRSLQSTVDHVVRASAVASTYLAQKNLALLRHGENNRVQNLETVFRIKNMVDLGANRKMAVLDSLKSSADKTMKIGKNDLEIPGQLGNLNLVYACRDVSMFSNAKEELTKKIRSQSVQSVVPEVLAPGDFVVFKKLWQSSRNVFSEALRVCSLPVPINDQVNET